MWYLLFVIEGAMTALNLSGTMLGFYPVKVLPSKTAIAPVNPTFLPRVNGFSFSLSRFDTQKMICSLLVVVVVAD